MTRMRSPDPMDQPSDAPPESRGTVKPSAMTRADWVRLSDEATIAWWELTLEFLSLCMQPQQMLLDATGRVRTVVEAVEEGGYEPVLAFVRWMTTPPDADAPRRTDRRGMTADGRRR